MLLGSYTRALSTHHRHTLTGTVSRIAVAALLATSIVLPVRAQTVGSQTIVLWTANVPPSNVHGTWTQYPDSTAAGQVALLNPNSGLTKIAPALAAPVNYFEIAFNAEAGVSYHLWVRLRASDNSPSNDSIHVQFSDAVDASGAPVARIGTTASAELVLQDGPNGESPRSWGWADNGWGAPGAPLNFAASGSHVIRVQQREDGPIVDQIVLSADTFATAPPGPRQNDTTILARTDGTPMPAPAATGTTVLWTADIPSSSVFGNWTVLADATAAGGSTLSNPNSGQWKISPALAAPVNYFETTFSATAGVAYHVWLRMRAESNSTSNDSVHMQFSDSLDPSGTPFARIGTTSSAEFVLQAPSTGLALHGWGWTENGWTAFGPNIMFESTGTHTLRIQQREDGAIVDQIVISPDAYLTSPPGWRRDDATILPATSGGGGGSTNQPPTASLTSPSDGATFTAPADITLTATASDADGTVDKVEFYSGTSLLGTSTAAPYSFAWSGVAAGSYTLKAIAYDNAGAQTSSPTVSITVGSANTPPTVSLTSPSDGATFTAPANITLGAVASDADGTLEKVEFYSGTTLLGAATAAPYSFAWSNVPAGQYTLSAVAYDNDNARTSSATVSIVVNAPNQPPAVSLTAPVNGATYTAPATVALSAAATDGDGTIQKVEFYSGSSLLGTAMAAPYAFTWNGVPAGTYTMKAIAYDNLGAQTSSATVGISVSAPNQPPAVSLTAPANGAAFAGPATVALSATATDSDGTIQKVEFYSGTTLLGAATAAPYSFTLDSVAAGIYTLKAIAYDNLGAQTTSASVTITVNAAPPPPTFTVAFTASVDHDTDVTSYLLEVFPNGADPNTAQALSSINMGKPTPDANREIDVNETSFLIALAPGTYVVTVSAVGPDGQARSAPFTFTR